MLECIWITLELGFDVNYTEFKYLKILNHAP